MTSSIEVDKLQSLVDRLDSKGVSVAQSERGGWNLYENEAALYELKQMAPDLARAYLAMKAAEPLQQGDGCERVAQALHGKLFATITDWREEICAWKDLPEQTKGEFRYVARAAIAALLGSLQGDELRVLEEIEASLSEQVDKLFAADQREAGMLVSQASATVGIAAQRISAALVRSKLPLKITPAKPVMLEDPEGIYSQPIGDDVRERMRDAIYRAHLQKHQPTMDMRYFSKEDAQLHADAAITAIQSIEGEGAK